MLSHPLGVCSIFGNPGTNSDGKLAQIPLCPHLGAVTNQRTHILLHQGNLHCHKVMCSIRTQLPAQRIATVESSPGRGETKTATHHEVGRINVAQDVVQNANGGQTRCTEAV